MKGCALSSLTYKETWVDHALLRLQKKPAGAAGQKHRSIRTSYLEGGGESCSYTLGRFLVEKGKEINRAGRDLSSGFREGERICPRRNRIHDNVFYQVGGGEGG